jgi:flagellar assembly protein FliH
MGLIKSENAPVTLTTFSMTDIENAAKRILLRAQQRAEQLLAEAQTEAEAMRERALADGIADGRNEGMARGLDEGRKAGHAAALAENRDKLTKLAQTLTTTIDEVELSRRDLQSHGVAEVVKLAAAIARRVTKRQGVIDPAVLQANLSEAMKLVVHASDVRVAVHPSQKQQLEQVLPQLQLQWPNLEHVELVEDATLAAGGCRVFTANGHIDADLDTQLDRLISELMPQGEDGR